MIVEANARFKKAFTKRIGSNPQLIRRIEERIDLFRQNPHHPLLRNHALIGSKRGQRAFSVTGDIRIVYYVIDDGRVFLVDIGTHNQVYK